MYIKAKTLDDLMVSTFRKVLNSKRSFQTTSSRRGASTELLGVSLELLDPRARLSRTDTKGKIFSCVGELLWYLSGTNSLDFISHYISPYVDESDDGVTVHGGYGPRLYGKDGHDQIKTVTQLLRKRSNSKKAVVQLFDARDLAQDHKDVPCTCTLQLFVRKQRLYMIVYMRSSDAFKGLPHDVFCFSMIQEMVACDLNLKLGTYRHIAGSLHVYDEDRPKIDAYLNEGWQPTESVAMPAMPSGNQESSVRALVNAAIELRKISDPVTQIALEQAKSGLDPYWQDIFRLLEVFEETNGQKRISVLEKLRGEMVSKVYDMYVAKRSFEKVASVITQMDLFA